MITGIPKFDGLAISSISADFLAVGRTDIFVKAAYISTSTGATYGWTSAGVTNEWSDRTLELLDQLKEQMERDLADTRLDVTDTVEKESAGLGEHLTGDTPQV